MSQDSLQISKKLPIGATNLVGGLPAVSQHRRVCNEEIDVWSRSNACEVDDIGSFWARSPISAKAMLCLLREPNWGRCSLAAAYGLAAVSGVTEEVVKTSGSMPPRCRA